MYDMTNVFVLKASFDYKSKRVILFLVMFFSHDDFIHFVIVPVCRYIYTFASLASRLDRNTSSIAVFLKLFQIRQK